MKETVEDSQRLRETVIGISGRDCEKPSETGETVRDSQRLGETVRDS